MGPLDESAFRQQLLSWYADAKRVLPWRETTDPYAIWVSEIMLQQTRVSAVLPYYERFLQRFPTLESLAEAPEQDLLRAWAGLGYYSRARNMQRAARALAGRFPDSFSRIRSLPGVGDYTAAAVASIAYGLPHAAVDGNVLRVLSRIHNDSSDIASPSARRRFTALAEELLDRRDPGGFNQAMMELGATVCTPKQPRCLSCPVVMYCGARAAGTQNSLPVKSRRAETVRVQRQVYVICRRGELLLWQRPASAPKLASFWELPEPEHLVTPPPAMPAGQFRHSITNHEYTFEVLVCRQGEADLFAGCKNGVNTAWIACNRLQNMALSTTARKAIELFRRIA